MSRQWIGPKAFARLDWVYPRFLELELELLSRCEDMGQPYLWYLGTRTPAEQDALYAQGRTAPGPKVTGAKGGWSMHNYGMAADHGALLNGQIDWDEEKYTRLLLEASPLGLQAGLTNAKGRRYDFGHVQPPVRDWFGVSEQALLMRLRGAYVGTSGTDVDKLKKCWYIADELYERARSKAG